MAGRRAAPAGIAVADRPRLQTSGPSGDVERTRTPIVVLVALLTIVVSLYLALLLDDSAATWLIREEHPVELLGALSLVAASIASFVLWTRTRGDERWPTLRRLSLLALGALFFFGFGEELSWGERVLGFAPPESLSEANRQDEANVHNLKVFSGSLDADRLFQLFWLVMGVLVPTACLWRPAGRRLRRLVPVLPLGLVPLFVLNQLLTRGFDELFEREPERYKSSVFTPGHAIFETKETVACILLAAGFWLLVRQWRTEPLTGGDGPPDAASRQPVGG